MSIIGSVVDSVTGTVASTANTLSGTTTAPTSSSATNSPSSTTTSAPASSVTTSAPTSTTSASTTSSLTPSPTPRTATPTRAPSATTTPTAAPTPITSTETTSLPTYSSSSSAGGSDISAQSADAWTNELNSERSNMSTSSEGGSISMQLSGSQSDSGASVFNDIGSEAGITSTTDQDLSTNSIVGLALGATGMLFLLVLLLCWCIRRRRTQRFSSFVGNMSLGATGNLPVFNTRGTERFATSSTSVSFGPFQTAQQESENTLTSGIAMQTALWEDEVITAMRIPLEKLTTVALLGSGGYGEVYRGLYHDEPVAMKVLLAERQKDLGHINSFLAEIKMMASIDHPCIVRFIGVAWDSLSDLTAVLEFMGGGDLRSLLMRFEQEQRPCGFDLDKAHIALQTAQAVTYLHSFDPKVLHRDLKSRNILLTPKLEAKVSDFGVSRNYSFGSMTAAVGTSLWMAPEVMMGERYDASADIFSLGVVLSELESHLAPYADARMTSTGHRIPDAALLQLIALGQVRINFSSAAPAALIELGHACVRLDPATRPSASEVHYQLQLLQAYDVYTL